MSAAKLTSFDVLIEIPKGSRNKYEFDFDIKKIRYDRMLFSSMMYPADYGFIPNTMALDQDPLDVLVLVTEPTFPRYRAIASRGFRHLYQIHSAKILKNHYIVQKPFLLVNTTLKIRAVAEVSLNVLPQQRTLFTNTSLNRYVLFF